MQVLGTHSGRLPCRQLTGSALGRTLSHCASASRYLASSPPKGAFLEWKLADRSTGPAGCTDDLRRRRPRETVGFEQGEEEAGSVTDTATVSRWPSISDRPAKRERRSSSEPMIGKRKRFSVRFVLLACDKPTTRKFTGEMQGGCITR